MCGWIQAVLMSALSWGTADTVFDIIVEATHGGHEEESKGKKKAEKQSLSHAQTMFLCAVTTFMIVFAYAMFIMFTMGDYLSYVQGSTMFFLNSNYSDRVVLIVGGVFCYYHYHFLVRAFEHSSSTVILPFLQFSSIFAFVLSMFEKYFSGLPWLSNKYHLIAYFLILVGGLSPATEGNLMQLFNFKFWNQPFVKYALAADGSHAIYTVIVSFVGEGDQTEFNFFANMEFFILTRLMFMVVFTMYLLREKAIQVEVVSLIYCSKILIVSTMVCELLTLMGYFSSVYAYQCYYQPGVVSAAESSLNLISNLFLAYLLKRYYNIGRAASLQVFVINHFQHIGLKVFACIMISLGLVIANL